MKSLSKSSRNLGVPVIVTDRDGVLKRGRDTISGVRETLLSLQRPLGEVFPERFKATPFNKSRIPFYILTNGGDRPETVVIEEINSRHKLEAA